MEQSPDNWREARQLFSEAREVAEKRLAVAPSFTELRQELAIGYEGLGRTSLAAPAAGDSDARALLERSLATWDEGFDRSIGH